MTYEKFIQPKNIKIGEREFAISMIPAIDALGVHNIIAKTIADNGLLGVTMLPANVDRQLLGYCALLEGDMKLVPNTDTLVNDMFKGNIGDIKALVIEMVKYNFGFLMSGDLLDKLVDREEATDSAS